MPKYISNHHHTQDRKDLLELNKKCEIDIDKFDTDLVNAQEKDLLKRMLAKHPDKRFTAKQCLEHRMLQPEGAFEADELYQIESELDTSQQKNIEWYS